MKSFSYLVLSLALVFVMACVGRESDKKIVARINNYEISKVEFEEEFKQSIFGAQDTPESRKDFLNNLINQKLILQDAQEKELDKKQEFLASIEKFWEQALLKAALAKKIKEVSGSFSVSDQEIRALYNKRIETGFFNATYDKAAPLLRREISKNKETQALSAWLDSLKKKSEIEINEQLLK